jgi:ABC-type siderophore export system fused ATPase/permease subunit
MTDKEEKYYECLSTGVTPPSVGKILVKGEWLDAEMIDRRRQKTTGLVRAIFRDTQGRRCTVFLSNNEVKEPLIDENI